jgi:hypothetical protein
VNLGDVCARSKLRDAASSVKNCTAVLKELGMSFEKRGMYKDDDSGCTYHPGQTGWVQVMNRERDAGSAANPACDAVNSDKSRRRVCACVDGSKPSDEDSTPGTGGGVVTELITYDNMCKARRDGHPVSSIDHSGACGAATIAPPSSTPAPDVCPTVVEPVCVTVGSGISDFFLAQQGQSCDYACGTLGDVCEQQRLKKAASSDKCEKLLLGLDDTQDKSGFYADGRSGCTYISNRNLQDLAQEGYTNKRIAGTAEDPQCGAFNEDTSQRRACACVGGTVPTGQKR